MAAVIQELVTKFGFEGSAAPLKEYNSSLGSAITLLGGMYAGLYAASAAFSFWADGILTGVDALGALSRQTKVSVESIQELNYIAGQTQSSAGAMESSLKSLTGTIGSAALKGNEDFARLGISVRDASGQVKSADKVLGEINQRFVTMGMSLQEQEHFASALGIDSSLLQMLNKSGDEMAILRDRARELGGVTGENVEQAEAYKRSMNGMWFAMNSIKQLVAVGVAPQLASLAETFTDLIAKNKDWVVFGIKATVRVISDLLAAFNRLLPVFALMAAGFVIAKIAAIGFGAIMGTIFSPVVLITAGIVAFLLIIDDLIVAMTGGKSVIADFFQEFFGIDIVPGLKAMVDGTITILSELWRWIKLIWDGWSMLTKGIAGGVAGAIELVTSKKDTDAFQQTIPQGTSAGTNMYNRSVQQANEVNIYTNDPQAAGKAVGDTLQRQLENANTQLSTGGR